jgi:RNA polymerase sigma factor (sigma-70 family)
MKLLQPRQHESSDADILALKFQADPNKAWAPLKKSVRKILHFASYKVAQEFPGVDKKDLESELDLILMDRANRYDPNQETRFTTWLMILLVEKLRDRAFILNNNIKHPYVKGEPRMEMLSCSDEDIQNEVDGMASAEMADETILKHLDALDENERVVLMLITIEECTVAEVARKLERPRAWVERHHGRALSVLRKALIK